jgi:hypothetical protein
VRSTTFLFISWCTLVAKIRVTFGQTLPVRHVQADRNATRALALQCARARRTAASAFGPARAVLRSLLPEAGSTPRPLKSASTSRGVLSLAVRPRAAIPIGPSWFSPVQTRRPMPLAVPRVKAVCPFTVHARSHPSPLKPSRAMHFAHACAPAAHGAVRRR